MIQYFSLNSYCIVRLNSMNFRIRIFKPFNKFSLPAESAAGTLHAHLGQKFYSSQFFKCNGI